MSVSELTDDEKSALLALLKRTINDDRYPLSPRIGVLKSTSAREEDVEEVAAIGPIRVDAALSPNSGRLVTVSTGELRGRLGCIDRAVWTHSLAARHGSRRMAQRQRQRQHKANR